MLPAFPVFPPSIEVMEEVEQSRKPEPRPESSNPLNFLDPGLRRDDGSKKAAFFWTETNYIYI